MRRLLLLLVLCCAPCTLSLTQREIKVCVVAEFSQQPVVDAPVECYDEDASEDEKLASGQTGSNGCVVLSYTFEDIFFDRKPDIYCKILNQSNLYHGLFTRKVYDDGWTDYRLDLGTINIQEIGGETSQSTTPSLSPTPDPIEKCELNEVELVEVFTDWRKMMMGAALAAVLTLPALSVYWRNTTVKPTKSYFYSCIVKFIGGFFSGSLLIGGTLPFLDGDCKGFGFGAGSITFIAAFLTEFIEFIFDVGRLVIFFGEPETLDFYQNARWDSKVSSGNGLRCLAVGLSSLPILALMIILWVFVFISNFVGGVFSDIETLQRYIFDYGGGIWLFFFLIFATCAFPCTGGYYLLRMICPCGSNEGEDKGLGFYWGRFKLIAVDTPSLIFTGLINPSAYFLFWTAEFINDMFPIVAGFIIEKYLLEEEEDTDDNDKDVDDNDKDIENLMEGTEDNEDGGKALDISRENCSSTLIPFEYLYKNKHLSFTVDRKLPSTIEDDILQSDWIEFCDRIDQLLKSAASLKEPKPDRCITISFIILGLIMSLIYWILCYPILSLGTSYPINFWLYFTILVMICSITGFICMKSCFGRDLIAETEVIDDLQDICDEYSDQGKIQFTTRVETDLSRWLCRGGLSYAPGVDSIKGIDCFNVVLMDPTSLEKRQGRTSSVDSITDGTQNFKDFQVPAKAKL
jgi:hypothetical protein